MTLRSIAARVLLQVVTRGATFGLNVAIVRTVSREAVGHAFQLEVLLQMLMFVPREALRNALLRVRGDGASGAVDLRAWRRTVDLAWLFIALSPLVALAVCALFARGLVASDVLDGGAMATAIVLYGVSCVVELLSLPLVVLCERLGLVAQRVAIEGAAVVVRAVVTAIGVLALGDTLRSYGVGQLCFAFIFSAGLYAYWGRLVKRSGKGADGSLAPPEVTSLVDLLPTPLRLRLGGEGGASAAAPAEAATSSPAASVTSIAARAASCLRRRCGMQIESPELALTLVLAAQALWKWLLTHGEKLLLMLMAVPAAQGGYQLVSNLGSLALRFLFFPIEEQATTDFARFSADVARLDDADGAAPTEKTEEEEEEAALVERLRELRHKLVSSVRVVVLLACVLAALAPAYSFLAVDILYGERYSGKGTPTVAAAAAAHSVPTLLACYAWYVLTMALNGVLEAFVRATASEAQLVAYNGALPLISLVYALLTWRLFAVPALGIVGLIAANAVNMIMRAALALRFATTVFAKAAKRAGKGGGDDDDAGDATLALGLRDLAPAASTVATLVAAAAATLASEQTFRARPDPTRWSARLAHIAVGGAALGAIAIAVRLGERSLLQRSGGGEGEGAMATNASSTTTKKTRASAERI